MNVYQSCCCRPCGPSSAASNSNVVYFKSSASFSSVSVQGDVVQSTSFRSESTQVSISSSDGFKAFESTLQRTYEYLANRNTVPVAGTGEDASSAEAVANNILGFIEQRLQKDLAAGASPEQLAERLQQGLEGFKKGFAEARQQIEALGWLEGEVEEDIGKTYDLVVDGIEDLRAQYVASETPLLSDKVVEGSVAEDKASKENAAAAKTNGEEVVAKEAAANKSTAKKCGTPTVLSSNDCKKVEDSAPAVVKSSKSTSAAAPSLVGAYGHYSYTQVSSFRFELETADGDSVTIRARTKDVYAADYRFGSFDNGSEYGEFETFDSQSFAGSRFFVEVDGHLDEDELLAIDALLAQVENLSVDFFEGDVENAYQQALNLGYDSSEIVGFSLNLRQTEVERATAAYQSVAGAQESTSIADRLQPLGSFVKDLLDALEKANKFGDPQQLLGDLADQIDQTREDKEQDVAAVNKEPVAGEVSKDEAAAAAQSGEQKAVADNVTKFSRRGRHHIGQQHDHFPQFNAHRRGFGPFVKDLLDALPNAQVSQHKAFQHSGLQVPFQGRFFQ